MDIYWFLVDFHGKSQRFRVFALKIRRKFFLEISNCLCNNATKTAKKIVSLPAYSSICVSKLHSLEWTHKVEIEEGVQKLFEWYKEWCNCNRTCYNICISNRSKLRVERTRKSLARNSWVSSVQYIYYLHTTTYSVNDGSVQFYTIQK